MTPVWSRDGTQLAYYSVRSGKPVVYLKAANSMAIEQKVWEPPVSAWTRDWMLDSLMSVELQEINGLLQSTSSRSLFQTHATAATLDNYDVTPDGKGFLANIVGTDETAEPLDLVVTWTSELKK